MEKRKREKVENRKMGKEEYGKRGKGEREQVEKRKSRKEEKRKRGKSLKSFNSFKYF